MLESPERPSRSAPSTPGTEPRSARPIAGGLATGPAALLLFAVALVLAGVADSQQSGPQIVAHPGVAAESISKKDLSRLFLKQRAAWPDGSPAVVVDQPASADVRDVFSREVLGKSVNAVESYWHGQVFAGKANPPTTLGSDAEVLDFVRRTPGAVGYVSGGATVSGVRLLRVTP